MKESKTRSGGVKRRPQQLPAEPPAPRQIPRTEEPRSGIQVVEDTSNLTERYRVPGERRVVDGAAAARLRALVSKAAAQVGMDKVTAAVVLADYAAELMAANRPPYQPADFREVSERAMLVHFSSRSVSLGTG